MSNRYKGAVISATPPTTTGGESGVASGAWTLEQQMQLQAAGLWPSQPPPPYIEAVFSTYLYTGTGATQTITNGLNLSGKGGLVWFAARSLGQYSRLYDTARGVQNQLTTGATAAQSTSSTGLTAFNSNGFTFGSDGNINSGGITYVSWTFREQPKFFDVVTYTGNGTTNNVAHALASVPGMVIVKKTSTTSNWYTLNRDSSGNYVQGYLNTTGSLPQVWVAANTSTYLTSTTLNINSIASVSGEDMNANGTTYVAYLFAHNAGGFGLTETENVISCGSYTGNGSTQQDITLGYEPQWLMIKRTDTVDSWIMVDNMRGFFQTADNALCANNANAEAATVSVSGAMQPIATGFHLYNANSSVNASGGTYIYIAIRRGPMAVPTTGTSVFSPLAVNNATGTVNTTGFPVDLQMQFYRPGGISPGTSQWIDRLRGFSSTSTDSGTRLYTTGTQAEAATAIGTLFSNTGFSTGANWASVSMSYNNLRRAPSFFDEVCYTGTGVARTVNHNLGVAPELMIVKNRGLSQDWYVYTASLGNTKAIYLNSTSAAATGTDFWNDTTPTASVFTVGAYNSDIYPYAAYLFATCPGVSKVGSYTGTGTTQTINCGFTGGARFVLIKRTDSTGDWYVWDSARGIIPSNDPYLLLNSTAAEVTGTDYVDTTNVGFDITSTAPAAINANGGTFIFLAIA